MGLVSRRSEEDEDDQQGEIVITGFGDLDGNAPTPIGLDMTTWGEAGRTALDERLHLLEAPHAWNGPVLIIDEADTAWIGRIIEQVEDDRSIALDPDAEQIAYDLAGWDDGNLSILVHGLQERAIPFGLDGEELVVHEADEARVDELVDTILEPEGADTRDEARAELMGELFIAADRLTHHPGDADARQAFATAAEEAASHAPPYGVEAGWWKGIDERCAALGAQLDAGESDEHEGAVEAATQLRDALRPYV